MSFFFNGKNFCLRGGIEQRNLSPSQLKREYVEVGGKKLVRYTYTEYVSKNRSGGIKQLRENNKEVHQYESTNLERCHILILDKYFSKMPAEARKGDVFYLKPKTKTPIDPIEPGTKMFHLERTH